MLLRFVSLVWERAFMCVLGDYQIVQVDSDDADGGVALRCALRVF